MEIIILLITLIIVIVLAFIIASAGAKRNIGFGWALFLGLFLSPIVSFVAVLLSDKILPDEFARVNKKWGCLVPSLVTFSLILTVVFIYYKIQEERNSPQKRLSTVSLINPFTATKKIFSKESSPLDKYKIDDKEGKTEIEKTVIIKFNNLLDLCSRALADSKNGKTISDSDRIIANRYMDDFVSFANKNETNISQSLFEKLKSSITGLQKDFPMDNPSAENKNVSSPAKERVVYTTDLTEERVSSTSEIEIPVNLNDYFNSENGWDESTNWNETGFEDDEEYKMFEKVLKQNGIYYSDKLSTWVKKK